MAMYRPSGHMYTLAIKPAGDVPSPEEIKQDVALGQQIINGIGSIFNSISQAFSGGGGGPPSSSDQQAVATGLSQALTQLDQLANQIHSSQSGVASLATSTCADPTAKQAVTTGLQNASDQVANLRANIVRAQGMPLQTATDALVARTMIAQTAGILSVVSAQLTQLQPQLATLAASCPSSQLSKDLNATPAATTGWASYSTPTKAAIVGGSAVGVGGLAYLIYRLAK